MLVFPLAAAPTIAAPARISSISRSCSTFSACAAESAGAAVGNFPNPSEEASARGDRGGGPGARPKASATRPSKASRSGPGSCGPFAS